MTNATREELEQALMDSAKDDAERVRIVAMLADLHTARQEKAIHTKRDEKASGAVKDWLALTGEREVEDGERGICAWLEERGGGFIYDVKALVENEPDAAMVLLQAAVVMAVRLDDGVLTRIDKGNGATFIDTLMKYRMPAAGTVALRVGTTEEREKARK